MYQRFWCCCDWMSVEIFWHIDFMVPIFVFFFSSFALCIHCCLIIQNAEEVDEKKTGRAKQSFPASESINLLLAMKYMRTPKQSDSRVCFDEF